MAYYFISIGGSGSKILEALTHITVAGILPSNEKLNVIAIDPDSGNGNFTRTSTALNNFVKFQNVSVGDDSTLFKNKIELLSGENSPWNPVKRNDRLDDLMAASLNRDTSLGKLYRSLYTKAERETFLNEGFRGHPSIGAAVLARKYASPDSNDNQWQTFINKIKNVIDNSSNLVKIFIAGSIFGGTGAAGIPTIARLIRQSLPKSQNQILIGGAMILPYFNFIPKDTKDDELFARSENFLTNSKAALKYYSQDDNDFDFMYLLGEASMGNVKFSVGGEEQKNDAHIIELYAALAAADFYAQNKVNTTNFKYVCRKEQNTLDWADLQNLTPDFKKRFVQFTRFIFAYIQHVLPVLKNPPSTGFWSRLFKKVPPWYVDIVEREKIDIHENEVQIFERYAKDFCLWLQQIESWDGLNVNLISRNAFNVNQVSDGLNVTISESNFNTCVPSDDDSLTLDVIFTRLSESANVEAKGFGKLLRRLYDSCYKA